jgi:N6-adenosine-specific RNA methylase IME4
MLGAMMDETNLPVQYNAACRAVAVAVRVDEVRDIKNKADAMKVYAFQAKNGQLAEDATEISRRATRRLSVLMQEKREAGQMSKGGRPAVKTGGKNPPVSLEEQGIDKDLAKAARKAAGLSDEKFEQEIAKARRLARAAAENNSAVVKEARAERHKEKKAQREARESAWANKLIALPNRKYGVILADPEWKFEFYSEKGLTNSSPDNHYGTSPLDVIKARDVPSIAADDCVLFLWATVPMWPQAQEVLTAWGFEYKSHFCWIKDKAGTGYWNRNKHELLLVGTRGKPPAPAEGTQWPSAIEAPVERHSAKPEKFLEMIEAYFPNVSKIELNRRGPAREGWDAWGNEAEEAAA